jgi:lipopolysaccharide export system permease protein
VQNSLDAKIYQTAFHSRIASLLVIPFICLLALPLSLGIGRNRGIGFRVVIGMLIGITYFMLQNTLIESAQIYQIQPILLGWIPFFILLLCTASAFRFLQWK